MEEKQAHVERPPNPRSNLSLSSSASTDDDEPVLIDQGIPVDLPLECLAGPALILPETTDLDGRTLGEEFDWAGKDEDEEKKEEDDKSERGALVKNGLFICLSKHSEPIAWACIVLFALVFIAVDVAIFVVYRRRGVVSTSSYGLQLWFTWIAFVWCIASLSQIFVEIVPWAIKKLVNWLRPQSTEVLRMRLSYYMALRTYIKLVLISSWAWGAWAFIRQHIKLPYLGQDTNGIDQYATEPSYVKKFILQLIVTSFHKKAYNDRVKENDKALRILDKLKKTKRANAQEFLKKRIRRKQSTKHAVSRPTTPIRSHSMDDIVPKPSIMTGPQEPAKTSNVKFPTEHLDTLIAIPPVDDRWDEKGSEEKPKKTVPLKHSKDSGTSTPSEGYRTPPALSRENTWFSRTSHDGNNLTQIPGKLFKEGYQKILSQTKRDAMPNSTQQAKALAKRIYTNIVGPCPDRDFIVEADLYPFFDTVKEAAEAFQLFDRDGNGDISKRELRSGCIRIYRERKHLSRSMRDLSQATGKLDIILMIIFVVVWVIIVCAAFGVNVGTDLMPLWSAFVAASFIFGTSAKDAFEAIIFVFVTHPFDAGDRVMIGVENWMVSEVGLLVTTFVKWDGTLVYAKNSVLSTQYIYNVRRSGRTGETNELQIAFSTPSWKIKKLIEHMQSWANQFPKHYTPDSTSCNVLSFQNQNAISLSFYFEHAHNWQDPGGRWLRHNNFMYELKEECERLEIDYNLPTQPFQHAQSMDAPPESYNMGKNSSYGLEGLQQRKPFRDDDVEDHRDPGGGASMGLAGGARAGADASQSAGTATTMMFAANMM
ncbi:hypothetical protein G6F37_003295 [Rhizopus arrhizus]|nr:hypothetical protein G6F38_006860 [Rhizopus arrhizus]KAG1161198.1 hypothetical protein G6F37_003295 [Rhizopus arrhizus]